MQKNMEEYIDSPLGAPSLARNTLIADILFAYSKQMATLEDMTDSTISKNLQVKTDLLKTIATSIANANVPIDINNLNVFPGYDKKTLEAPLKEIIHTGSLKKLRDEFRPEWLSKLMHVYHVPIEVLDTSSNDTLSLFFDKNTTTSSPTKIIQKTADEISNTPQFKETESQISSSQKEDESLSTEKVSSSHTVSAPYYKRHRRSFAVEMDNDESFSKIKEHALESTEQREGKEIKALHPKVAKTISAKIPHNAKGLTWVKKIWEEATEEEKKNATLQRNKFIANMFKEEAIEIRLAITTAKDAKSEAFRAKALDKVVSALESCPVPIISGQHAKCLAGIGEKSAAVIDEIIQGNTYHMKIVDATSKFVFLIYL